MEPKELPGSDAGVDAGPADAGDGTDGGTSDAGSCEDDPRFGQPCDAGLGECARTGQFVCTGGVLTCDTVAGESQPEICDGRDNDCDGLTDDDVTPPACPLNLGVCATAAPPVCEGDAGFSACSYGPDYEADETRCDGLDNDCDGTVDEVSGCLFTLVGQNSAAGFRDGPLDQARFSFPSAIAVDGAGNLYVADTGNHAIRKVDTAGVVTTLAGSGRCGDQIGPAAQAEFCEPMGVAVDAAGTVVYVSDSGSNRIRKIAGGIVSDVAGSGSDGFLDGPAAGAKFRTPMGLYLESNGDLLIADSANQRIRRYIAATQTVVTFAGNGNSGNANGGSFVQAQFNLPGQLIKDAQGNLYVSELGGHRIRKLSSDGITVSVLAGSPTGNGGYTDAVSTTALFSSPGQLAIAPGGAHLYVADTANHRIRAIPLNGTSPTASIAGGATNGSALGRSSARFDRPIGLVFANGALFVADATHAIKKITFTSPTSIDQVKDFAGSAVANQSADGPVATARMAFPYHFGIEPMTGDILFVEDETTLIRRWSTNGFLTTIAGDATGFEEGNDNGPVALATFDDPVDVQAGPDGRLYVAEEDNEDIRVIDPVAGTVALFAGSPIAASGTTNGSLANARFNAPHALAFWQDGQGHDIVYVGEDTNRVIRKIDLTAGMVSTFAGAMGQFGTTDGDPGVGHFRDIHDLAIDPVTGELYVADSDAIRHVDTTGHVTTVASSFPDEIRGIDLDGTGRLVVVEGRHVWQVTIANGNRTLFFAARPGVQDGLQDDAGLGDLTDVKAYPDHYLLLDYRGRRFRQLWK